MSLPNECPECHGTRVSTAYDEFDNKALVCFECHGIVAEEAASKEFEFIDILLSDIYDNAKEYWQRCGGTNPYYKGKIDSCIFMLNQFIEIYLNDPSFPIDSILNIDSLNPVYIDETKKEVEKLLKEIIPKPVERED